MTTKNSKKQPPTRGDKVARVVLIAAFLVIAGILVTNVAVMIGSAYWEGFVEIYQRFTEPPDVPTIPPGKRW
jgi:hypothetical protein